MDDSMFVNDTSVEKNKVRFVYNDAYYLWITGAETIKQHYKDWIKRKIGSGISLNITKDLCIFVSSRN